MLISNSYRSWHVPPQLSLWIRVHLLVVLKVWACLEMGVPRLLRWFRAIFLGLLWLSFEAYIALWKILTRLLASSTDRQVGDLHRIAYCLLLSLLAAQPALLVLAHIPFSWATFLLSLLHGLAVSIFWERGRRWCKRQLNFRPSGSFDPARPFDGLELGN